MQQTLAIGKSGLCSTKVHTVLQNKSNNKIYSKEWLQ